jgi:hypothetical protein
MHAGPVPKHRVGEALRRRQKVVLDTARQADLLSGESARNSGGLMGLNPSRQRVAEPYVRYGPFVSCFGLSWTEHNGPNRLRSPLSSMQRS